MPLNRRRADGLRCFKDEIRRVLRIGAPFFVSDILGCRERLTRVNLCHKPLRLLIVKHRKLPPKRFEFTR